MDRRDFLRGAGLLGLTPLLAACARALRTPLESLTALDSASRDPRDRDGVWREGAAYARWTPSPHNVQPWLLRVVSPTHAELLYNPARLLPKTDPTSAFSMMGLVMFAEYLSIAVAPRGYAVRASYDGKPLQFDASAPVLFANLELVPLGSAAPLDRDLILRRQTSRLPYDGRPVREDALRSLASIASAGGHKFAWSSRDDDVAWAVDLNRFTLFDDLDRTAERSELRKWIRPSDREAAAKKDGLWAECLSFPGWLLQAFFDKHEKWGSGWRKQVCGEMLVKGMAGTRTIAWWSGPFSEPAHWIAAGQVLGRSWLTLASQGVHMHPFGSIITNPSAHANLVERVGRPRDANELWLLARMGRSAAPPRSYRMDERDIFINAGRSS